LPCSDIPEECQPVEVGPKILEEYLKIKPDWVSFCLLDVLSKDDTLFIYYTCLVPGIMEHNKGEWSDIGSIEDGDIQKMVFEAGQRLLSKF
jgi:hypothetical protein